jgi:phosphatidylinositol-4-phosphate 3-kinase
LLKLILKGLIHAIPGNSAVHFLQGCLSNFLFLSIISRLQLLLRSVLATCGAALRHRFLSEQMLVQQLDSCADLVKSTKESQRLNTLLRELEPIHSSLGNNSTSLPIGPSLQVNGLEVRLCSYFPSNTLPLKLAFHSAEPEGNLIFYLL